MHAIHFAGHPATTALLLIEGALLLLAGRRLFWLFVGVVGFFVAYYVFLEYYAAGTPLVRTVLAIIVGVLGALLAVFVQRLAAGLAGFFIGIYFAAGLLGVNTMHVQGGTALVVLAAGVVAAMLAVWLFDPALIVLSSLAGASLLAEGLRVSGNARLLVWAVLAAVGIAVQARTRRA
jgi:hypothetical protein